MMQRNPSEKDPCTRPRSPGSCVLLIVILILTCVVKAQRVEGLAISTGSFSSQSQEDDSSTTAKRLYDEGQRLFAGGTSDTLEQAINRFEKALLLWRKVGDRRSEAITLSFIGKAYDVLGEKQKALDCYYQTLLILREVGDRRSEANTLNNIGLVHDARGEKRKALEFYGQALLILSNEKDRSAEAITLVNIGLAYDSIGEKQKALSNYQRAITILRAAGDRASEAVTLNNLGLLYDSLGDKQRALDYYGQALPILRAIGDTRVEAVTLNNIGYVYDSLDEKTKSLDYYQQALPVLRTAGDRFKEVVTINNIGLVYHSLGQFKRALDYFTQALNLRRAIGDRPGEAVTLGDIGMVYDSLGEVRKALDSYNGSLRLSRAVEDHSVEASTLRRIALLEEKRGNLFEARAKMEAALAILEALRLRIANQDLRASYFASVHKHFETYIALLMRMHSKHPLKGYDALALRASERSRARSMLEMLAEAHADLREGVEPELLERRRLLQIRLRESAEKQTRFLAEKKAPAQTDVLRKEIGSLLSEYRQVEGEIRISSPRYAALTQPNPLSLREIQKQVLDQDSLLLEYALGDEKSFLWAVTPTTIKSFELPPRAEIESAARLAYQLLTARNQQIKFETAQEKAQRVLKADNDYQQASERLSQMLLGPVATQLGKMRLLIVCDGVLDYIPFAALPDVNAQSRYQPLMLGHEVVTLPSASMLALLRREMKGRRPAEKTLAVIADPVFDKLDPRIKPTANEKKAETRRVFRNIDTRDTADSGNRISKGQSSASVQDDGMRIQRLPFTRIEADEIISLLPPSESKRAVDFDANRETATSSELGKYRFVHFATHGILNSQHPELSGIVLSLVDRNGVDQDGFLWAHEVFNLHLPVEMVVLSGCRTGLGKEIRGEGLVGLTRGFMYAGARRVVISLWDISDEASAALMAEFYKAMLGKERLRPAAALKAAQIAVLKDRRWQAPYYWAAFVIQGEPN